MKKFLLLLSLCCAPLWAQCSNTSLGNGVTAVKCAGTANPGAGTPVNATFGSNTSSANSVFVFGFTCNDSACTTSTSAITLSATNAASETPTQQTGGATVFGDGSSRWKGSSWLFSNPTAGTLARVAASGGTPYYMTALAGEFSGLATSSPYDSVNSTFQVSGSYTSATVSTTTTNANDLVLCFIELADANAITPGSGFTELIEPSAGIQMQAKTVTSAGSQSCTWTFAATSSYQAMIATVKISGATPRRRQPQIQ